MDCVPDPIKVEPPPNDPPLNGPFTRDPDELLAIIGSLRLRLANTERLLSEEVARNSRPWEDPR